MLLPVSMQNKGMKMFTRKVKEFLFENGYIIEKSKVVSDPETGISTSKDEDYIFQRLKEKYGEVKRQYKNEERHPWTVDFYIPSEDMFIEYLKHWSHGRRKYNPDDKSCQEDKKWLEKKAEDNEFYARTLKQWTKTDVEKEQHANENGLNFYVFYNLREFDTWMENPKMQYVQYKDPDPLQYDSEDYFAKKAKGYDTNGNDSVDE